MCNWITSKVVLTILIVSLMFASVMPVSAAPERSTLDTVITRGKVIVGIGMATAPFGYFDDKGNPAGFDVDYAQELAKSLKVKLEVVPLEGMNRIPFLLSKKVDVVIATFSVTLERAQAIAFTTPYTVDKLVLLSRVDSGIKRLKDLAGKRVAVPKGTVQDTIMTERAPKGTIIDRYSADAETILAVQQGKADATSTNIFSAQLIVQKDPKLAIGDMISVDYMSFGVRRDDIEWLNYLNWFLIMINTNGTSDAIYKRWFMVEEMPKLLPDY